MAQDIVETDYCNLPGYLPSHHYGQGYESNEGHGRHEGDEGNEEEVREQDCKGPHGQGNGVPWVQGEDCWWVDQRCLTKNKYGKIVSKKASLRAKKHPWTSAVQKARKALGLKGFVAIKKGSALYKKAKEFYN